MDFQFWIWLVIVVITLIVQAKKKTKPSSKNTPMPGPSPTSEIDTFEDLLREIENAKGKPHDVRKPAEAKKENYKSLEKEIEARKYQEDIYDEYRENPLGEEIKPLLFEEKTKKSVEETKKEVSLASLRIEKRKAKRKHTSFDWLKELKTKNGLKKAFVMTEILSKKY